MSPARHLRLRGAARETILPSMQTDPHVPSGWRGLRADFAHYCTVHGATAPLDKLLLPLRAPALWALAVYRFGRWLRFDGTAHSRLLKVLHRVMWELVRHATGILIHPWVELESSVWIASFA